MGGLSPRALEVLARVKRNLQSAQGVSPTAKREEIDAAVGREVLALSAIEIAEVHEASRQMAGKAYANWAAGRFVAMLRGNELDAHRELKEADLWCKKKLRRGYLVRTEWLEHAYQAALRLARAR